MSLLISSGIGAQTTVDGVVNLFEDLRVTPNVLLGTTINFGELPCDQLPHLSFFLQQRTGNAVMSFQPQYAIRLNTGGGTQQYLNLPGGTIPASGSLLLNFDVPANFIRMVVTIPPDPAQVVCGFFMVLEANSW